jgi:hypothetical protein
MKKLNLDFIGEIVSTPEGEVLYRALRILQNPLYKKENDF